jgi:uncharacterized membrane protein
MEINEFISKVSENIVNPFIILLISVAFLVFIWGVFIYLARGSDPGARRTGGLAIIFGLIGLAIMFSAFGIVNLIKSTLETIGGN